jgi:hypothetical protein
MGLSDELKTLQDLHEKGNLTDQEFAAAKAATLQKHGSEPTSSFRLGRFIGARLIPILILVALVWYFVRINYGSKATNQMIATAVHAPIEVKNEVENVPASSWKAVALNLPYSGTVNVNLQVVRGNPVDVFLTTSDQLEAMKKEQWSQIRVYADFNASKTTTYQRSAQLGQGAYYLVMRDTSLGILSSSASDISVKVQLNP